MNGKQRPEWDRLLADVKAGKIDAIVVWNQDRGWRMMSQLEDLRRFFESLGRRILLTTTLTATSTYTTRTASMQRSREPPQASLRQRR